MSGLLSIKTTIVSAYILRNYLFIVFIPFTIDLKIYILNCIYFLSLVQMGTISQMVTEMSSKWFADVN